MDNGESELPITQQPESECRSLRIPEDDKDVLVRAILRLRDDQRDVFLLHRMAGMTYAEISARLGMPSEDVQAALAAALLILAQAVTLPSPDAPSASRGSAKASVQERSVLLSEKIGVTAALRLGTTNPS